MSWISTYRHSALSRTISSVGVLSLGYLFGAAVVYFHLPGAGFLLRAFAGAEAWREDERNVRSGNEAAPVITPGNATDKAFDGYTLQIVAALGSRSNSEAVLLDMRGRVRHTWKASFSQIWPDPPHLRRRVDDSSACLFSGHVYPNGDMLVVFHAMSALVQGYGLVKLDRDSNVVWKYSANVHHDVDVGNDGAIYAIKQQTVSELPAGLERFSPPCMVDYLVTLTPDGRESAEPISIVEAFLNSPYSLLLSTTEPQPSSEIGGHAVLDVLHTNFVHVLSRECAPSFPMFREGQVLISVREIDTIAVLDPQTRNIVWAARGPWRRQHDAQFLKNGHLLIFDNLGSIEGSRVLEYDPQTQAFPWSYTTKFHCTKRGMAQRLPNGNTLVVNSEGGEILEVTRDREIAWSCTCPGFVPLARRFRADNFPFLTAEPATGR